MKKKIMLIHHSGLIGGGSISLLNILKELKDDHEVVLYLTTYPNDFHEYLKKENIESVECSIKFAKITYYSGGNNIFNPKFWYHSLKILTQKNYWNKILEKESPDLVMVNSKVMCWFGKLTKIKKIKSICFVRETVKGNPKNLINNLINNMLDNFNSVIFLSEFDSSQANLKKAKKIISHDFINMSVYNSNYSKEMACKELGINSSSFNILYVGGVNKIKGIYTLLKALKILEHENIKIIIAGSGLKEGSKKEWIMRTGQLLFSKKIEKYIDVNRLQGKIEFIGVQKNMSIPYTACDILVFPMTKSHQARPAFEVGLFKKTVLISNFSNIYEFITDLKNGLYFNNRDEKDLADKIMLVKNNSLLRGQLGEANFANTMSKHLPEFALKELLEEIDQLLK